MAKKRKKDGRAQTYAYSTHSLEDSYALDT